MATYTSSTFSTDNQFIKYRVQATTNSENVVNSTTNVTFKIQVWRTNTGYTTYGAGTAYLQVGGSTYTASITASQKFTYNSYTTVLTKTLDVARGEIGNDSTYAKAKVNHDRFSSSYQGYTFNFPAINRFALITASTNFTDEGTPSITYTNPAGTELVTGLKARITWNDGANYSAWTTLNDEGGTSNLTLTTAERNSMLAACSTSNSLAVKYDLQSTMDSTDYHHYADATMSVINADPTPGTLTYKDTNAATVAITGSNQRIVQLHSTLVINTTASTAKKQATITSYSLNINGNDYTPDSSRNVTFTNPNVAGTYPATMTTTDSRGNTATAVINIPILQYSNPSIVSYSLTREGNFYDSTIINVTGSVASIDGHNTMTITEKHRVRGTSTWSTATTLQNGVDKTLTLSNTSEWEVMITVTDAFTSYSYTATVGKGIPLMFWDNKRSSVSINGFPTENNQLFVGGNVVASKSSGEPSIRAYRSDTDVGVELQVDADGEQAGVYSDTFEGYLVHSDLSQQVYVGEKPFGGFTLWEGSLKTGSFNAPWGYNVYVVEVDITNNASRYTGAVIPACWILEDTTRQYCVTDEAKYLVFTVQRTNISGEQRVVVTFVSCTGTGGIRKLFGIN